MWSAHFRARVTGVATRKERYEPTILQCGKHMGEEVRAYNSTMCRTHQQHLGVATRKKRYEPTILPCGSNKEKRYEPTILRARTHRYLGAAPMKEEVRAYNSCMGDTHRSWQASPRVAIRRKRYEPTIPSDDAQERRRDRGLQFFPIVTHSQITIWRLHYMRGRV
jgi:hypothetical protein